jgi:hypothetical protein
MGLLDDLSMGLGLKDRDQNYYDRTAETLGGARGEQYRQSSGFGRLGRQGLLSGSSMGKYRDMNDMFDGGGPMARGGRYEGGGLISFLANLANAVAGRDMGEKVGYGAPMEITMKPKAKVMPTSTYDAERMMQINDPMGNSMFARNDNPSSSAMGYGEAYPKAVAPSISNTAKTTTGQDFLYEIATDTVVKRLSPEGFATMPPEERRALIDQEYTKIVSAIEL